MIGKPALSGMIPKKGDFAFTLTLNNSYQFDQTIDSECGSNSPCDNSYSNISASFLTRSGFEFITGRYMGNNNAALEYTGIAYHIKKRKYGVGLHFSSYKHNLSAIYNSKPRETGISIHLRFRKNIIKPFIYYSRTVMYNESKSIEFFVFGATALYNNLIFATYINAYIEDALNINTENAQMNITLGVLLN